MYKVEVLSLAAKFIEAREDGTISEDKVFCSLIDQTAALARKFGKDYGEVAIDVQSIYAA